MGFENVFETIVATGVILDPDIELALCELNLRVSLNSKGYPKIKYGLLSRIILNAPKNLEVDHINGNVLDNRLHNLRLVTRLQNMWNTKTPITNKSGIKGVCLDSKSLLWVSSIFVNGIRYRKKFKCFEEAVDYRKKLEKYYYKRFNRKEM